MTVNMCSWKGIHLLSQIDPGVASSTEDFVCRDIADPYSCTLDVWTSLSGHRQLEETLRPILKGLDPTFKFVRVQEHKCSRPPIYMPRGGPGATGTVSPDHTAPEEAKQLATPALAVALFLREGGPLSAEEMRQKFQCPPWRFHHKIELSNVRRMPKVDRMAQQQYYSMDSAFSSVPLWSVNSVHYGNEHLRFTIFTRSHEHMVDFYRTLSGCEVDCRKTNFALFELYTQPGLDVQLGLKHCPSLNPKPMTSAFLHFKVKSLRAIVPVLYHSCTALSDGVYITKDPDGNGVILEEQYRGETEDGALNRLQGVASWGHNPYCHSKSEHDLSGSAFRNGIDCASRKNICSNQKKINCNHRNMNHQNWNHGNTKHMSNIQSSGNCHNRSRSSLDSGHFSPVRTRWNAETRETMYSKHYVEEIIV